MFNDEIVVTGSVAEIGFWDPHKGAAMHTSAETYPLWRTVLRLPKEINIEYKYVIKRGH